MDAKTLESAEILFNLAYAEDVGDGDITTNNLVPPDIKRTAVLVAKEEGVIAGLPVAEMVFRKFDQEIEWKELKPDGSKVAKDIIVAIQGKLQPCSLVNVRR